MLEYNFRVSFPKAINLPTVIPRYLLRICSTKQIYLQNIKYNYCICVYIYPEEFLLNLTIEITVWCNVTSDVLKPNMFQRVLSVFFHFFVFLKFSFQYTLISIFPKSLCSHIYLKNWNKTWNCDLYIAAK